MNHVQFEFVFYLWFTIAKLQQKKNKQYGINIKSYLKTCKKDNLKYKKRITKLAKNTKKRNDLHGHKIKLLYQTEVTTPNELMKIDNREIKIHVYAKRQTWICTTWPSFFQVQVLYIRIVLDSFYLLNFCSEKFSTWIWLLPFGVNVNLNLSNNY